MRLQRRQPVCGGALLGVRRRPLPYALLLAVLLPAAGARAQPAAPRFERIGRAAGLSNGYVFDLQQDHRGFLWVATADGLNRYDGYGFTVYRRTPFDSTSLPSSYIASLHEDGAGVLWLGSRGAVARYDAARDRFASYVLPPGPGAGSDPPTVLALASADGGGVWAGSAEGLYRVGRARGAEGAFRHRPDVPTTLSDDRVQALLTDREGRLWAGTGNGLNRLDDARRGRFTRFLVAAEDAPEAGRANVRALLEDPRAPGVLWLATRDGLVRFDARTGATAHHPLRPLGRTVPVVTFALTADPTAPGALWVGTTTGLVRFYTDGGAFTTYHHDPADPSSLSNDFVGALLVDRFGMLWAGARVGAGLNRLDLQPGAFTDGVPPGYARERSGTGTIGDVVADPRGVLWVARAGVERVDRRTGAVTAFRHDPADPASLPDDDVTDLLLDRRGTLWVGTRRGGLARLAGSPDGAAPAAVRGRFARLRHDPADPASLSDDAVIVLFEGRDGALWVGTNDGLNRVDPATGRVTRLVHDPADPASLLGRRVHHVIEDPAGALWVGTDEGVNRVDPATGRVRRFDLGPRGMGGRDMEVLYADAAGTIWIGTRGGGAARLDPARGTLARLQYAPDAPGRIGSDVVTAFYERPREPGVLWIGTEDAGLERLDVRTGRVRHFHAAEGFPSLVYGITEDAAGRLWMGTNEGLVRFDPASGAFRVYGPESGTLPQFWYGWQDRGPGGELLFWSVAGLLAFDPTRIRDNPAPPSVVLSGLRLFNRPLAQPIAHAREVRLGHDENALTFEFVGLHFRAPALVRYAYRLDGFDPDWVPAGTRRTATYTNLPPGSYTFRVQAANSDGVWTRTPTSLRVVIAPPFWATWPAYVLYALVAGAVVAGTLRSVRVRAVRREREATRERELAQARELERAYRELDGSHRELQMAQGRLVQQEKLASLGRLTAGIAHEIKNPLNFINNFAALCVDLVGELRQALAPLRDRLDDDVEGVLDDLATNATKIEEHGKRADAIVRNMLAHSRGSTSTRQTVALNALVGEYAALAYHGARAKDTSLRVALRYDLDPAAGAVALAPQDFGRVLINLIGNAFDAVAERAAQEGPGYVPAVTVATRRAAGRAEVRVTDNGVGMPPAVRARVFEPFFTTKPTGEGTGLGLSLSHDIVVQGHGGLFEVESEPGVGTTFVVSLPAPDASGDGAVGADLAAGAAAEPRAAS